MAEPPAPELVTLTRADPPPGPVLLRLGDLLADAEADARRLHDARLSGAARGPVTGLPRLDRELSGALEPGLHVLHGTPGAGKSAMALQVAATCGCPALLVTLEMRPLVLLKRLAARVTQTYLGRLSTGELSPQQALELYRRAAAAAPELHILDATQAAPEVADLERHAQAVRGAAPHLLLVIDSLHTWADTLPGGDSPEYDRLNAALAGARALAARLSAPVLAVCERNRVSMAKGGLSAGAGTRKIEYGAETVLDLDAQEDARPDATGARPVTLKLAKNRNGTAGAKVRLLFHGATQTFREDVQ